MPKRQAKNAARVRRLENMIPLDWGIIVRKPSPRIPIKVTDPDTFPDPDDPKESPSDIRSSQPDVRQDTDSSVTQPKSNRDLVILTVFVTLVALLVILTRQ